MTFRGVSAQNKEFVFDGQEGVYRLDVSAQVHAEATSQVIAAVNEAMKGIPADPANLLDAVFKKVTA